MSGRTRSAAYRSAHRDPRAASTIRTTRVPPPQSPAPGVRKKPSTVHAILPKPSRRAHHERAVAVVRYEPADSCLRSDRDLHEPVRPAAVELVRGVLPGLSMACTRSRYSPGAANVALALASCRLPRYRPPTGVNVTAPGPWCLAHLTHHKRFLPLRMYGRSSSSPLSGSAPSGPLAGRHRQATDRSGCRPSTVIVGANAASAAALGTIRAGT